MNKQKEYKSKRLANIELLRIIAMLLVLIGHWNTICNGDVTYETTHSDLLKSVAVAWGKSWSFICVPCFVIISGYFGIKWKWKGLFSFLFQIFFWYFFVYFIGVLLGTTDFSMKRMLVKFSTSITFNWFFCSYLGLYMLSPLANAFVEKSSEKELMYMLLAFFTTQTLFGWIMKSMVEFNQGLTCLSLLGYYLLGAYLKRTTFSVFQMGAKANFVVFLSIGLFCTFLNVFTRYLGVSKDVFSYISPLQVLQTTFMFLFCKKVVISNKYIQNIILFFSSSAFAALLMHSWEGIHLYYDTNNWIYLNMSTPALYSLFFILFFFISACCLDKTRIMAWNFLCKQIGF